MDEGMERRVGNLEKNVEVQRIRLDGAIADFRENAQLMNQKIDGMLDGVKDLATAIRELNTNIPKLATQVKIQWIFISAGILGMMGMAAAVVMFAIKSTGVTP